MSNQSQNKDNRIGNGNRTIEFETYQLQGVFPNLKQEDFFSLQNGNKAIQLVFDAKLRWHVNRFEILMEFLYDYPNSPPNVKVMKPDVTGAPHTIFNNTMCYNNPSLDWKPSFSSYDVAIMIQSWIYAYCKWMEKGTWDWYQDVEYIPPPIPIAPIKRSIQPKQKNVMQTIEPIKNERIAKQDHDYYKTPLYYCNNNQHTNKKQSKEEAEDIYNTEIQTTFGPESDNYDPNNYNNSIYGRTDIDNYTDHNYGRMSINNNSFNDEPTSLVGRIIFATIFSLMFLAYNHLTTFIVMSPFFALLFIGKKKDRAIPFIILSLFIIISNPWSFVIVPTFGLLYTKKKRYLFPILSAIILFWVFMALYGYNIVDLQIIKIP